MQAEADEEVSSPIDAAEFIQSNLNLLPVPAFPGIKLYTPHPGSGLRRLDSVVDEDGDPLPPYWAYVWGGGAVLVRHIQAHPEVVAGRRVLDLGSGSGIVGIAAAQCGAASVLAAETDANGLAALALNAEANGVAGRIDFRVGGPESVDGRFGAVVANLTAKALRNAHKFERLQERLGDEPAGRAQDRERVAMLGFDAKRYVGAQIGVFNGAGQRVGQVNRLRNVEYLFVAGPAERVAAAVSAVEGGAFPAHVPALVSG